MVAFKHIAFALDEIRFGKDFARVLNLTLQQVFIEARVGRWWYVLFWAKGSRPCAYRSMDGTPPRSELHGRSYFGHLEPISTEDEPQITGATAA